MNDRESANTVVSRLRWLAVAGAWILAVAVVAELLENALGWPSWSSLIASGVAGWYASRVADWVVSYGRR